MAGDILLSRTGDRVTITLSQPARCNALDSGMWTKLRETLGELGTHPPRVLIVTGAQGHFSAGMDLQPGHALLDAIRETGESQDADRANTLLSELRSATDLLASFPAPTIAAIEGSCVGAGLEIALACDIRVMSKTSTVGFPETRLGFIPDIGGTARAVHRIGASKAALLVLSGRRLDGEKAQALGLAEVLVETGEATQQAELLAEEILAGAPTAIQQALQVLRLSAQLPLADALAVEKEAAIATLLSGECVEGINAYMARRTPVWDGK